MGILSEVWLRRIADKLEADYYLLPASLHEMIAAKADTGLEADQLLELVSSVNINEVREEDRLADQVLYYSRKAQQLQALF